jgi:hypothetical protein
MPPPTSIVVDPGLALIAAGFFGLMTSALTIFGTQWAKSRDREDDRRDRAMVATKVADVAVEFRRDRAERTVEMRAIRTTSEATHAIVNNQRTVMLRQIAVLARIVARDHPDDTVLQRAAAAAEHDLAQNEALNAEAPAPAPAVPG